MVVMADCFIIMPLTVPNDSISLYGGDVDHFLHVLETLFIPAITSAEMTPVLPKATGSGVIRADIIDKLFTCDLVLCDISTLNPNVFFEFGIRTALDKPVALVVDDMTQNVPFDMNVIKCHQYNSSIRSWEIAKQINAIALHIMTVLSNTKNHNPLWAHFSRYLKRTFEPEVAKLTKQEIIQLLRRASDTLDVGEVGVFEKRPRDEAEGHLDVISHPWRGGIKTDELILELIQRIDEMDEEGNY